jgi:hypothetical protein
MSIFKVGDRVFHIEYGWGTVKKVDGIMSVIFTHGIVTFIEGRLLSFTEYTLQGFSQERPIELPEVGELCLVRDFKDSVWKARNFKKFTTHFLDDNGERWDYFKRIKILD